MQARAVATRQQIVIGAAQIFERLGYDGATVGDIVEASGMTRGAMYFHFKSKDELAQVVVEEQHAISIAAVQAIAGTGAPAIEQMVMLCHEMGRQMVEDPIVRAGIRLTLELSAVEGPPGPYRDWIAACRTLADGAVEQGDIGETIDLDHLARFVISAFTGVQLVSNVLDGRVDLETRIDQMWLILLPGIMPPARRRKIERIRQARSHTTGTA